MASKLNKLDMNTGKELSWAQQSKKPAQVAESWDDDSMSSNEEMDNEVSDMANNPPIPDPPPPTPISPRTNFQTWGASNADLYSAPSMRATGPLRKREESDKRQEKSTAVANRLIAAGLGVQAPKRSEEERAFDKAAKANEIKRRNREREEVARAKEEDEKAKAALWN